MGGKICLVGGQQVRFSHQIPRPDNSPYRLAIRPEEIQIGGGGELNLLNGKVETVMFLGAVIRMLVRVGGTRLTADLFNEKQLTLPSAGDEVVIGFPDYACWLM